MNYYTRLTSLCPGLPRWAQKGKTNLDFSEAVAVASAGLYASLHLAPDRQPRQHPTTQFFTGRMPFLPPNQQRQSTEGSKALKACHETNVKSVQKYISDKTLKLTSKQDSSYSRSNWSS